METKTIFENFTLLVDGKNAFPEILRCIREARNSIKINMFIWRDDQIGNELALAVLESADRGVQVYISADRYGVVLENAEEAKRSFFHRKTTFSEELKIRALECFYPDIRKPKRGKVKENPLYQRMINHSNITVSADVFKADHSKYYVIDDEILILGGINVEDKENGQDLQGRVYQDYMAKLVGKEYVDAFFTKLANGTDLSKDYFFGVNYKEVTPYRFEMEELYLDMINKAEKQLLITMAYFSPLKNFLDAICNAYQRGVEITILIPEKANFQNDTNRKTVKKLMKRTKNGIKLYFSPKMVHTKLIATENFLSFGSTNITKKAFGQLSELNLFVKNIPSAFTESLLKDVRKNHEISKEVCSYKEIKYNKAIAFIEGFLV